MTDFIVLDVFTQTAFGGNQLAVIPDATGLDEEDLIRIAREFNFSETTFVYPPQDPENSAQVRIFTPTRELPFAGHPTIGTAIAMARGRDAEFTLELEIGAIPCVVNSGAPATASFRTEAPLTVSEPIPVVAAANCLGLNPSDVVSDTHLPQLVGVGLPFAMVELNSENALKNAAPKTDEFARAARNHGDGSNFAIYCYRRDDMNVQARMFAPLKGIAEDAATGSAAAALGAHLAQKLNREVELTIEQGIEMGRPSTIHVQADASGVVVRGAAVETMRGKLTL